MRIFLSLKIFLLCFIFPSDSFSQDIDTLSKTANERIIRYRKMSHKTGPNVNFILFDAQYLTDPFISTLEYWSYFEDVSFNYNLIAINQKQRSKYNQEEYIHYLDSVLLPITTEKNVYNIFVSHSGGSLFVFNLIQKRHPINACLFASPDLYKYPIDLVDFSKVGQFYASSSKKDSFGHDTYFKLMKRRIGTKREGVKFELFEDLKHINLFQPSVYNGLSSLFHVFLDFKIDYKGKLFSPQNFNKLVASRYNCDTTYLSEEHYYFHYLEARSSFSFDDQMNYVQSYLILNPRDINFIFAKGDLYFEKKRYSEALKVFEFGVEQCKLQKVWNISDYEIRVTKTRDKLK